MSLDGHFEQHPGHLGENLTARQEEGSGSEDASFPIADDLAASDPSDFNTESIQPNEAFPPAQEVQFQPDDLQPVPSSDADGLFRSWATSGYDPWPKEDFVPVERIPHFGHLALLGLITLVALLAVSLVTRSALHFHLLGINTLQQAVSDIRYTLGSQALLYLLTLLASLVIFPLLWHKDFFSGLQWNGVMAFRLRYRLFAAAFACFLSALLNGWLMPGPDNTPIDKLFRTPGSAWMLFIFGITFAPFFEEILFRGFLLPALCTAFDWVGEKATGRLPRRPFASGHPRWSVRSMTASSIVTSIPFALMHAEQTSYAVGPFLLLVFVSMVLCWARLSTRSLAASVLVHASYNFMLFSLMLLGTGGFQHMDKM